MPERKISFMGILANTDSSILKMKLNHGFTIEEISSQEINEIISTLENISIEAALKELYRNFVLFIPTGKVYLINKTFNVDIQEEASIIGPRTIDAVLKFDEIIFHGYLSPTIRLIRLYKEGNICIPLRYYFFFYNDDPKLIFAAKTHVEPGLPYNLTNSELSDLYIFIRETKIPFTKSYLQFAFDNFELSYDLRNINLSFLSLMMSLESLFNPGKQELRYRISRNAAVLLGKDKNDSETIYSKIKKLYDLRSKIIHTGEKNIVKLEDLLTLRNYVRESIKKIHRLKKEKEDILNILNSSGFGETI